MEAPVSLDVADGLLEVPSPPTLRTTVKGDDSSFELCAIVFLKGKETWENGVGIRSLISRVVASAAPCGAAFASGRACRVPSVRSARVKARDHRVDIHHC